MIYGYASLGYSSKSNGAFTVSNARKPLLNGNIKTLILTEGKTVLLDGVDSELITELIESSGQF